MEQFPKYRTGDDTLDEQIQTLAASATDPDDQALIFELITTAVRLGRENVDRGNLKLMNHALKELRYANQVFEPYSEVRKVSIFGSARTPSDDLDYICAVDFAREIAERGWMVITGAGPGIMEAGIRGATAKNSFGVGIQLPFEAGAADVIANDPKFINFRYFFTRKLTFVKESHGFAMLPGGFGTMDESFELLTLLQTGKSYLAPVVLLDHPGNDYWPSWLAFVKDQLLTDGLISPEDLDLLKVTDSVDDAVDEICSFYRRYHSMRFVGRRLVLRLSEAPTPSEVESYNDRFADIVVEGQIEAIEATDSEREDRDQVDLPRLAFNFDRASYGRLRALIDAINNGASNEPGAAS